MKNNDAKGTLKVIADGGVNVRCKTNRTKYQSLVFFGKRMIKENCFYQKIELISPLSNYT